MALLDNLDGVAVGCWSTIKRKNAYAGKAMRCRRSSDNDEQDIDFDTNDIVSNDSKIEDGTTSFSTWYGSSTVNVVRIYDQTGNANNAIQTNVNEQPIIVSSGTLVTDSDTNTSITYDGSNDHFDVTDNTGLDITSVGVSVYSYFDIGTTVSEGYTFMKNLSSSSTTQYGSRQNSGDDTAMYLEGANYDDLVVDAALKKTIHTYDLSNVKLYKDGTLEKTTARTTAFTSRPNIKIGARSNSVDGTVTSGEFTGEITEIIVFNSAISQSDVDEIQNPTSGTEYTKTLTANVTATGTQIKFFFEQAAMQYQIELSATVNATGTQTKAYTPAGNQFTKTLTANVDVTGTQTKDPTLNFAKTLSATVNVTGTQTKVPLVTYTKTLTANVTVTGTQTKVYQEQPSSFFVTSQRQSIAFGGENDTRIFMYGNGNKLIYSELEDGIPSAEYFPENNSILVSSDNYDITGLTKQYDRLIIHKENEAHYSTYSIDATLGTIFSVFPINDTIGNVAFGETRLILNNPFVVDEAVYQFSGTNVRDERNAILMSERVQLGLDTLDLTTAVTFDFEKNFEYFVCVGSICYVYNYKVDVWYKYELTDTPTVFYEIEGEAYFGTTTGEIMQFDSLEFTDNATIFTAEWETGFMNFGANWIRKFLTYGWITLKPEAKSSVVIEWETDQGASIVPYDLQYNNLDFGNVDFGDFTFSTNFSPQPFREKFKAKKFSVLKMKGKNETDTDFMTILAITLPATTGGQVK